MRNLQILAAGLVAATALAPSDGAEPSMRFTAAPAVAAGERPADDVRQYRRADTMTVVLQIPTACGLVPANPSFKLSQGVLQLHYSVPALGMEEGATSCFSTAVFTLKGLPRRPLRVVPHRDRKPALIAAYEAEADVELPLQAEAHTDTAHGSDYIFKSPPSGNFSRSSANLLNVRFKCRAT